MRKSVIEKVYDMAVSNPNKVAVVVAGQETTYQQLYMYASGMADYLYSLGVSKGDVVVARATQTLDYVVLYLGVHLAGGVITSVEKGSPADAVELTAKSVGAKLIVWDSMLDEAKARQSIEPREFPKEDDSADILFTTGTTGVSKGVELSHKALVATAENLIYGCGYTEDIVLVVPGPLNHANAIRKLFTTFVNGSTIYILNGMMNLKAFFDALDYAQGKVACCLPPSAIRLIFTLSGDSIGKYADKIDFIESATAPLPEPDKVHLCKLLPKTRLLNNYGSSESASVCMYDYNKNPGLVGCVGKAMPNSNIIIVDDERNIIESSKEHMGLLACVGDVNMKGYVNEPELTKEVLIDGVVYTNDVGYIDENGFVYVSGRQGDVINVGGLKVAPTEVESATLGFEGIDDCICISIDDKISGKALKLLVVCQNKENFNVKELKKYLISKLERYKVPATIECVDHVERTYNGKLNRKYYQLEK